MLHLEKQPLLKPVFFVTGVMRSGTTLLHRILTNSCQSQYVKEVDSIHVMVESFEVLDQYQAFRVLGRNKYVELYRQLLTSTFNAYASEMYGDKLVLKDPMALRTLELFRELAPATKFLLTIRDPLDTAASIFRVRNRQKQQGRQSFISSMEFGDVANYVESLSNVILVLRAEADICVVRYEALVRRDAGTMARLADFVGVQLNPDLDDTSSDYDPEHAFWTSESGRPITASSIGKYREHLSAEQISLVSQKMARFRDIFGYE